MHLNEVFVKDIISKSNIGGLDYVINPYVGCTHACKYCYACFMKRFTNHPEAWGTFLDVKNMTKPISSKKLIGKNVFMSSVTDPYLPQEKEFQITRKVLEQLKDVDCNFSITTKSTLILRDIDLLKQFKNLIVSFSINTLDEKFKRDMDKASSIQERLSALKTLHENGIRTAIFQSPMFPFLTDFKAIIEASRDFTDEYWFENLNLRPPYKHTIMKYIQDKYPQYFQAYVDIFVRKNYDYWFELKDKIKEFCQKENIEHEMYFHY